MFNFIGEGYYALVDGRVVSFYREDGERFFPPKDNLELTPEFEKWLSAAAAELVAAIQEKVPGFFETSFHVWREVAEEEGRGPWIMGKLEAIATVTKDFPSTTSIVVQRWIQYYPASYEWWDARGTAHWE